MSSMCPSDSRDSNMPGPTECLYATAHTSLAAAPASSDPDASFSSCHLSDRIARAMPITESLSRPPPLSRYSVRIPSITSMTRAFSASGYAYSFGTRLYTVSPVSAVPTETKPEGVSYVTGSRSSGTAAIQQSV